MDSDDKKNIPVIYADGCMYCVSDTGEEFSCFIDGDDSLPLYPINC